MLEPIPDLSPTPLSRLHLALLDLEAIFGTIGLALATIATIIFWTVGTGGAGAWRYVGVALVIAGFLNMLKLMQFFLELREALKIAAWNDARRSTSRLLVALALLPFLWTIGALVFAPLWALFLGHAIYLRWHFLPARLSEAMPENAGQPVPG